MDKRLRGTDLRCPAWVFGDPILNPHMWQLCGAGRVAEFGIGPPLRISAGPPKAPPSQVHGWCDPEESY